MSGYDCRNKCVLSFFRNTCSDGADYDVVRETVPEPRTSASKRSKITTTKITAPGRDLHIVHS